MANETLTPRQIVAELDKYIIGQKQAKRSVAVALRNRYRRSRLDEALRDEIVPKNILMIGPTGVGKTEIARRLAKLVNAPFVKVEATKFTEVGYVGRDVESMVRDLVETAIRMVKTEKTEKVRDKAESLLMNGLFRCWCLPRQKRNHRRILWKCSLAAAQVLTKKSKKSPKKMHLFWSVENRLKSSLLPVSWSRK